MRKVYWVRFRSGRLLVVLLALLIYLWLLSVESHSLPSFSHHRSFSIDAYFNEQLISCAPVMNLAAVVS